MPENVRCSRFPGDRNPNKLQDLATCIWMKLTLLVGYNLPYSADSTVQFLVAFLAQIFINIVLDMEVFLYQQDSRVSKKSDSPFTVFSMKCQKKRQKAQELTGDVTRGYLHFCTQSSVQTLLLSWPLHLPLNLILCESEVTANQDAWPGLCRQMLTELSPCP